MIPIALDCIAAYCRQHDDIHDESGGADMVYLSVLSSRRAHGSVPIHSADLERPRLLRRRQNREAAIATWRGENEQLANSKSDVSLWRRC